MEAIKPLDIYNPIPKDISGKTSDDQLFMMLSKEIDSRNIEPSSSTGFGTDGFGTGTTPTTSQPSSPTQLTNTTTETPIPAQKQVQELTPVPSSPNKKYQSHSNDWRNNDDWQSLRFNMSEPQYFSYQFASPTPTTNFNDLNGDSTPSSFILRGRLNQGGSTAIAPAISEHDPDE